MFSSTPTRFREFNSPEQYKLFETYTGPGFELPLKYKFMNDVNNKRRRPQSPCESGSITTIPRYSPSAYPGGDRAALNIPPSSLLSYSKDVCAETVSENEQRLLAHLAKKQKELAGDFSSLNFLYELREIGSLFLRADAQWKGLNRVFDTVLRPAKSYRPTDFIFGVLPLIADVKTALKRYDAKARDANFGLKRFKNYPINRRFIKEVKRSGEISFFAGNGHYQEDSFTVVSRLNGELSCGIPFLAQVDPAVYRLCDILSIDISAANAWEAIPFSWFFDWLFPVGSFLESLPSFMRPEFFFYGVVTHKIKGVHKTETRYSGPSYYFKSGNPGSEFTTTLFNRKAFNGSTTAMTKWDFMGGVNSLSRSLVARDILQGNTGNNGRYEKLFK